MPSGSRVVLISKDDATVKMVSSALSASAEITLGGVHQEVSELRGRLSGSIAQAAVVDIDSDPSRILSDLRGIISTNPETCVIVVSKSVSEELLLRAMQAGARDFLRKESIPSELNRVLERLLWDEESRQVALGTIISVFSAGGGCGATTVAVNLANELRLASSGRVMVIDLDSYYGAIAAYLGVAEQYGIADVLGHSGTIDEHLIESSACSYMEDFHLLLNPAHIKDNSRSRPLHYHSLPAVLEACRRSYGYTVIDAPRVPKSVTTNLADLSRFVLVVFQLTVKDLHFARSIVSLLTESGVPRERIIPLANRCRRRGPLVRLEDSKKVLGVDSLHCIRSDWRKAMICINRGQPLAKAAPRSGLRRDFRRLAAEIHASKGRMAKGYC